MPSTVFVLCFPYESRMKLRGRGRYQLQFIEPGDQRFEPESGFSTDTWLVNRGAEAEVVFAWIQNHPFMLDQAASRLEKSVKAENGGLRPTVLIRNNDLQLPVPGTVADRQSSRSQNAGD